MREGTLLERDVNRLFSLLGFKVENNVKIKGYEIDIYAISGNQKIIIECKQRDKSKSLDMRNLIHQWSSKNSIIGASKIILITYGIKIAHSHRLTGDAIQLISRYQSEIRVCRTCGFPVVSYQFSGRYPV